MRRRELEAYSVYHQFGPTPGRLEFLPSYGAPEDEIELLPSTVTQEDVKDKASVKDVIETGGKLFELIGGIWREVKPKKGDKEVVTVAPPKKVDPLPWIAGGLALVFVATGIYLVVRD
jgi:hypothetical protein